MAVDDDTSQPFAREKPWFERHVRIVLGGLSALLLAVILFTSALNDTSRHVDAPLLAEGTPPVPVQVPEPLTRATRAEDPDRTTSAAAPALTEKPARRDDRPAARQKPSNQPQALRPQSDVIGRPLIVDAATLIFSGSPVCVDGITSASDWGREINRYLGSDSLICKPTRPGYYSCIRKSDGKDFAELMVSAGFARSAAPDGPLTLTEEFARIAKRGMWQSVNPPATKACSAS